MARMCETAVSMSLVVSRPSVSAALIAVSSPVGSVLSVVKLSIPALIAAATVCSRSGR